MFDLNLCRRMTLRRADAFAVLRKGKPFFIVVFDHLQQYFVGQRIARKAALGMVYLCQQGINIHPAVFIQSNADLLGMMAQDKAEEFADRF